MLKQRSSGQFKFVEIRLMEFFDKRQTVSGVGRGEQRKIYDQRRRDVLPVNGIKLIEIMEEEVPHLSREFFKEKFDVVL